MAIQTGREMAGLAVVSLTGGDRLGRIDDVIFDSAKAVIVGILVDRGGMFSKPKFLEATLVRAFGSDALTIDSEAALTEYDPAATGLSAQPAKPLGGRPVLTEAGSIIGKIADIAVDTDTLQVPYFVLSTGLLDNALHGKPHLPLTMVHTIGADSVIVLNSYEPKASEASSADAPA